MRTCNICFVEKWKKYFAGFSSFLMIWSVFIQYLLAHIVVEPFRITEYTCLFQIWSGSRMFCHSVWHYRPHQVVKKNCSNFRRSMVRRRLICVFTEGVCHKVNCLHWGIYYTTRCSFISRLRHSLGVHLNLRFWIFVVLLSTHNQGSGNFEIWIGPADDDDVINEPISKKKNMCISLVTKTNDNWQSYNSF